MRVRWTGQMRRTVCVVVAWVYVAMTALLFTLAQAAAMRSNDRENTLHWGWASDLGGNDDDALQSMIYLDLLTTTR